MSPTMIIRDKKEKNILRPLSGIETHMANSHATQRGCSQITRLLHVRCALKPDALKDAYYQLCKEEPLLSATLECHKNRWFFIKTSPIKEPSFSFEEKNSPLRASDALLEEEMHQMLDPYQHLIRLRLISSKEKNEHILCLTQHHCAGDAFTAKRLLSHLLHKAALPAYKTKDFKEDPPSLHIMQKEDAGSIVHTLIFEDSFLKPLTKIAQKQHISLNALLCATFGEASRQLLNLSELPTLTAVSSRHKETEIGCFIDVAPILLKDGDLIQSAKKFHQKLCEFREKLPHNLTPFSLHATKEEIPLTVTKARELYKGVGFTNSGRMEKLSCPSYVKILAYRSVTRRDSGDMSPVFHFSFLNNSLVVSIVSSSLLIDKDGHYRLAEMITSKFQHLIEGNN